MSLPENATAENVLATIGAILWSVQILPQIWKSYRTKSTRGLSEYLMLIWFLAALFMGAYLVAQRLSIPLQIQPQAFGLFSAISYAQCLHYGRGLRAGYAVVCCVLLCAGFAGFEAGSVYALWAGQDRGVQWPILLYGYIGAALLALGLAPQYWEIYKLRQVVGISLIFLGVDILGGVFSFLSLFFRAELDVAAFVSYALVVVLDGIVIILAWILNPIARRRKAADTSTVAEREGGAVVVDASDTTQEPSSDRQGASGTGTGTGDTTLSQEACTRTGTAARVRGPSGGQFAQKTCSHDPGRGDERDGWRTRGAEGTERMVSVSAHMQYAWSPDSGEQRTARGVETEHGRVKG